jgi:serine/threonine-protein kinase
MKIRKLGRYEIVAELGQGAMGVVYRALDPVLNRVVAIKTINMALKQDEIAEYEARFYQEAQAAGGLNHPNIVTVYDIGKSGTVAYMAMEFLEGDELAALLTRGTALPVMRAVNIAMQVADGLAYAHEHDVIHRDIKPANIMITNAGLAKITDFGIARMRAAKVMTQTGVVLGSPKYMSPEQVLGKRAEARSDIFSLGAVLYEMLTGKAPFVAADVNAMMFQTLNLIPPPPSTFKPVVPAMLDLIIAKMLAKGPDDRYSSARELVADLRECSKLLDSAAAEPAADPPVLSRERDPAALLPGETRPVASLDLAEAPTDPSPTLGLARQFDSMVAAKRLAAETGALDLIGDIADANGIQGSGAVSVAPNETSFDMPRWRAPAEAGWNRKDQLTFGASVAVATAVAVAIVLI